MENIAGLYKCIKNLEEEDGFEKFDDFYDKVMSKEIVLNTEDIKKICMIFINNNNIMEPHNFIALEKMTFATINNGDLKEGFKQLIEGLIEILDKNTTESQGYLKMLINSYSIKDINIFSNILEKYPYESKKKIGELINNLILIKPDLYKEKGNIILKAIEK